MTSRDVMSTRLRVVSSEFPTGLGVLSLHLDGEVCRVGCEFCYLGQRKGESNGSTGLDLGLVEQALERLDYREVAVAVSEPVETALAALPGIRRAAGKRLLSVTTTVPVAQTPGLLDGVDRLNLSIDPRKGLVSARAVARSVSAIRAQAPRTEIVLIVSLTTPEFAARLIDEGLLATLVDLPGADKVALNALKPPPPWCGRDFWMRALARLAPLLDRALDRRLFLDCWVAARLLGLGGCPARADLSPAGGGVAFRSCVYQASADFVAAGSDELAARLRDFTPPAVCPFPIP